MRKLDEDAFRDSADSTRSSFHEPSVRTRDGRKLQSDFKRRRIWARVAFGFVLIGAALMLWVRFRMR